MDHAFLAFLASEGFSLMRAALLARVSAVGQPLGALYSNALIASDVDATELHLRLLPKSQTARPHSPESQTARPFSPKSQTARPPSPKSQTTRPSSPKLQTARPS